MSCNVCGTVYDGKFCPNCGAPAVAETHISSEQVSVNQKKTKVNKALIPGYGKKGAGWIKNPKKAAYNKIYRKTSFSIWDIFK